MTDLVQAKPDIALMGPARSGKDATASYLVSTYGYARVAFADPLKAMALRVDPIVFTRSEESHEYGYGGELFPVTNVETVRLSDIVSAEGWESAKDSYPEVRRVLQTMGQAQRELEEDYWLRIGMAAAASHRSFGRPVVITDCRYPNEYHDLRAAGFQMVRLHREGASAGGAAADHSSETAIARYHADVDIYNDGSLDDLYRKIDWHAGR